MPIAGDTILKIKQIVQPRAAASALLKCYTISLCLRKQVILCSRPHQVDAAAADVGERLKLLTNDGATIFSIVSQHLDVP
jgi:hypothetical protein